MPDNSQAIADIRALLNSGATTVVVDGQTVQLNHDSLRRRLRELQATDTAAPIKRPRVASIDASTGW
ncbi:MAG: hypothetical protein R3B90_21765 [Planctomycetaceae bacterium]